MRKTLWAVGVMMLMASTAVAQQPTRALDFEAMDINQDGYVSRSEWSVWFLPSPGVVDSSTEGPVRRARPMEVPSGVGQLDSSGTMFNQRLRGQGLAGQESLAAQRDRVIRQSQGDFQVIPDFDALDANGDSRISREEMGRRVIRPPAEAYRGPASNRY